MDIGLIIGFSLIDSLMMLGLVVYGRIPFLIWTMSILGSGDFSGDFSRIFSGRTVSFFGLAGEFPQIGFLSGV